VYIGTYIGPGYGLGTGSGRSVEKRVPKRGSNGPAHSQVHISAHAQYATAFLYLVHPTANKKKTREERTRGNRDPREGGEERPGAQGRKEARTGGGRAGGPRERTAEETEAKKSEPKPPTLSKTKYRPPPPHGQRWWVKGEENFCRISPPSLLGGGEGGGRYLSFARGGTTSVRRAASCLVCPRALGPPR
jgi:hypothetical protein